MLPDGGERDRAEQTFPQVEVKKEPEFPWGLIIVVLVVAVVLFVLYKLWARRRLYKRLMVRGLQVSVRSPNHALAGVWLKPISPTAHRFPIAITGEGHDLTASAMGASGRGRLSFVDPSKEGSFFLRQRDLGGSFALGNASPSIAMLR